MKHENGIIRFSIGKVTIAFFVFFLCTFLHAAIDPFYTKLFQDGKELYKQKKYIAALDNFRVAEFGFQSDAKLLQELYLYYALTLSRANKPDEAKGMLERINTDLGVKDLNLLTLPVEIEKELRSLFSALKLSPPASNEKGAEKNKTAKPSPTASADFNPIFSLTLQQLLNNRLREGEEGIKKLRRIDKKNPRILYLEGLLRFQNKNPADATEKFRAVLENEGLEADLVENTIHYLVLSHYMVGDFGLTLAYYRMAGIEEKKRLQEVYGKVQNLRSQSIARIGQDASEKDVAKLCGTFSGDSALCADLLRHILDKYRFRAQFIQDALFRCLDYPSCYDNDFILTAVTYLKSLAELETAKNLIRKSRFAGSSQPEDVPVLMAYGEIYYDLQEYTKAMEVFEKVKSLSGASASVDKWLEKARNGLAAKKQGGKK